MSLFNKMFLAFSVIAYIASVNAHTMVKRMVESEPGDITDNPYLVFIGTPTFHCNGAIVSKRHVITAAHCVRKNPMELILRSGSSYKDQGGTVHHIKNVTRHENFYVSKGGVVSSDDIAVVEVEEPFVYDETTQPVRIDRCRKYETGAEVETMGFGRDGWDRWPSQFAKLRVSISDLDKCNQTYASEGYVKHGQICGRSQKKESYSCAGDSGAPVVHGEVVVGVQIYGGPCELPDTDEVYTEVAYYSDWIDKHVVYDDPESLHC